MCTSVSFTNPALYGRTLDLERSFGEQVVITPRDYVFHFHDRPPMERHYAMIGMATVVKEYPLYFEAANEKGLYVAGLSFSDNGHFFPEPDPAKENVAPYELIPLLLGSCETLSQARRVLENLCITGIPFMPELQPAMLHWHIADSTGSLVVEPQPDGLHIYDDPVGVMTNNPRFPFHLLNLNNYQGLSAKPPENRFCQGLELRILGQGMGAMGLPGDISPTSRFVRAAFLRNNCYFKDDEDAQITQFFRVLNGVYVVRGSVITQNGQIDETVYSCCYDARRGIYYYSVYDNCAIHAVRLFDEELDAKGLLRFPVSREAEFICDKPQA